MQWITDPVTGWRQIDSARWSNQPHKDPPPSDRTPTFDSPAEDIVIGFSGTTALNIDNHRGWVNGLCVLGLPFSGDHIALIHHADHIEVVVWNDDPGDFDPSDYDATIWRFYNEIIESQFKDGFGILTFGPAPRQEKEMFLGPNRKARLSAAGLFPQYTNSGLVKVHDWSDFILPDPDLTRHGVWLLQTAYEEHRAIEPPHFDRWEDWL